jgi:broad specificity phosphatase PhoE
MDRLYADDWHTILVVLHGGVNRAVLSWAIGGPGAFFGHFEQSPACINIIDGDPQRFIVRTVNFTAYDPVHLGPRHSTLDETLAQ